MNKQYVAICEKVALTIEEAAEYSNIGLILSILVYTLFSRMFDLMQPPAVKHSIAVV